MTQSIMVCPSLGPWHKVSSEDNSPDDGSLVYHHPRDECRDDLDDDAENGSGDECEDATTRCDSVEATTKSSTETRAAALAVVHVALVDAEAAVSNSYDGLVTAALTIDPETTEMEGEVMGRCIDVGADIAFVGDGAEMKYGGGNMKPYRREATSWRAQDGYNVNAHYGQVVANDGAAAKSTLGNANGDCRSKERARTPAAKLADRAEDATWHLNKRGAPDGDGKSFCGSDSEDANANIDAGMTQFTSLVDLKLHFPLVEDEELDAEFNALAAEIYGFIDLGRCTEINHGSTKPGVVHAVTANLAMHGGEESRLKTAGESIGDAGSTIAASGLFDCVRDVLNKETEFLAKRRANVDTTDQLCSEYEQTPPRATTEAKKNELLERKSELQLLEMTKMKETSEQDSKAMERLVSQLKTMETDNAAALEKLRAKSKADLERLQQKVVSAKSDKVGSSTLNSPELLSALSVDVMCFDVTVN